MNILEIKKLNGEEVTKAETYALTMDPRIGKLSALSGAEINVTAYCIYEDQDKKDPEKTNTVISFMDDAGFVMASNSQTVRDTWKDIMTIFQGDPVIPVIIEEGRSKNDRRFFQLVYNVKV